MLLQCGRFIFNFEFFVYRFSGQYVVSYLHKNELADLPGIVNKLRWCIVAASGFRVFVVAFLRGMC